MTKDDLVQATAEETLSLNGQLHADYFDEDDDPDDFDPGEECGRWNNGRLTQHCRLAGTEWCDWECPYSR